MNTCADKSQENKMQSVANVVSQKQNGIKSTFQLVDNRPEAIAQRRLKKMINSSPKVMELRAIQDKVGSASQANQAAQLKACPVIQRITEEDMNQAVINIRPAATAHGYTREMLESIIQHRFAEILPGNGNRLLLGKGVDENTQYFGRLVYDCYLMLNGSYCIDVFHAHGGQTESPSPRGY
ncbi:hypothetical protein [Derxia gummosa]|uniref:Uncharacterized protein n=1 Tax=Derxia gummosa DSM 723 TaxID=1121388 RepID=A0A8B6XCJ6_9BURK|nr:hypothetical protein [Derxia gummosa]